MGVEKDKERGTYTVRIRYKDFNGENRVHKKRGFKLKREAKEYETEFLRKLGSTTNMDFTSFVDIYKRDVWPMIKRSTQKNRECVIETKILPFFGGVKVQDIKPRHIIQWQNELLARRDEDGKGYSPVYLKKIRSNLNAIFNHAERFYDLKDNPIKKVKCMGKEKGKEIEFWTLEEYMAFREVMKEKPEAFYAFEVLYWTGIRLGELMALTRKDIDLEKRTITINKTYQVIDKEELVTSPKTDRSNRVVDLPVALCDELEDFLAMFYGLDEDARPFNKSKGYYENSFKRGLKKAEIKDIKIHALRHSHITYLLAKGFTAVEIGVRTGQESIKIVLDYAHVMPEKKVEVVDRLQTEMSQMNEKEMVMYEQNL